MNLFKTQRSLSPRSIQNILDIDIYIVSANIYCQKSQVLSTDVYYK